MMKIDHKPTNSSSVILKSEKFDFSEKSNFYTGVISEIYKK